MHLLVRAGGGGLGVRPDGIGLGGAGFVRWLDGEATNRDDALIGAGLAYVVVMVLFFRLAIAYPMPVAPMS